MLEASDIVFTYKGARTPVLSHVSLSAEPKERVGIIAPSGFGKTTLMKVMAGYLKPDSGTVRLNGRPLPETGFCPVQMIWQHPEKAVNPRLRMDKIWKEGGNTDDGILERLGIESDWMHRFPRELSGGELQRFCIARALGTETKYLIADEISAMLDPVTQSQIWNFLIEETQRRAIGMLVVSHSRELLDYVCTRSVEMDLGRPADNVSSNL